MEDNSKKEYFTTTCNHIFHKECLLKTYDYNTVNANHKKYDKYKILSCPMCRCKLSIDIIDTKTFACEILSVDIYTIIKNINKKIKELHLNKKHIFISGGFATALYSSLTNKNTKFEYNDIDIYYADYDDLYDYKITKHYELNCNSITSNIKSIQTHTSSEYDRMLYDFIFLNVHIKSFTLINVIDYTFQTFDLSCCKIAFTINDNSLTFYIHNDYYLNKANICGLSMFYTGQRMEKYKKRGFIFDDCTSCCHFDSRYFNNSELEQIYEDENENEYFNYIDGYNDNIE
jgi:hypothetical protein